MPRAPAASDRRAPRRRARPHRAPPRERGDRARDPRDARTATPGETAAGRRRARAARPPPRRARAARREPLTRRGNASAHRRRRLRRRRRRAARPRAAAASRRRDRTGRAARARACRGTREPLRRARALRGRVAARAARAEVHRRDELKARREDARPAARAIETKPSSSGWRSASSAGRGNSASSSSSRTPRCARLASPGRMPGPPPTIAAVDALWCGARKAAARPAAARRDEPGDRVDPRHLERRLGRRAAAGSPAGAARASSSPCPAARRAGGCARPPRRARARVAHAPARARRRGRVPRRARRRAARRQSGSGSSSPRRYATASARCRNGIGLDAGERRLGRRLHRAQDALEPHAPRTLGNREDAADAAQAPVERELADRRRAGRARSCGSCRDAASTASAIGRS